MATRNDKGNVIRGTEKPCPGCGQTNWRRVDEVCRDCKDKIKEATETRAKLKEQTELVRMNVPYHHLSYSISFHEWGKSFGERAEDRLTGAIKNLVELVMSPFGGNDHRYPSSFYGVPELFPLEPNHGHHDRSGITIDSKFIEPFQKLDAAIRDCLRLQYEAGFTNGSNVLKQLVAGELSYKDADKLVETREKFSQDQEPPTGAGIT
jgi:hypothetical protein